jgi:hypothetical protein
VTTAWAGTDDLASANVSRKLGYQPNGLVRSRARDALVLEQRYVLDREGRERHGTVPVEIDGLDACQEQFGG